MSSVTSLLRMFRAGRRSRSRAGRRLPSYAIPALESAARRRLPTMVYDFVAGGAGAEHTLVANERDLAALRLVPSVLTGVTSAPQDVTIAGRSLAMPVLLAPAGLARLVHPEAELAAVRAAGRHGTAFVVSTASSYSVEEVSRASSGPVWLQLYPWRDREVMDQLVKRASACGCDALVVTVDLPAVGRRERDLRNGMTIPPVITAQNAFDIARHPRWLRGLVAGPPLAFGNLTDLATGDDALSHGDFFNAAVNPQATWEEIDWIRERWPGTLVVKGLLSGADATLAVDHGADAVIVSNHGGRQLDGAPSTVSVLPEVVAAVGARAEVLVDGGIRRGSDVVKCLALGARAVMVGRAWLWGLAVEGEVGIDRMLDNLAAEIDSTMLLCGRGSLDELDPSLIVRR